jgi:hypothetical protein
MMPEEEKLNQKLGQAMGNSGKRERSMGIMADFWRS